MKTYILFLVLFFFACSTNKQLQSDTSDCSFNDKISENDNKLNVDAYKKGSGGFTIIDNDTIEIRVIADSEKEWRKINNNKITNIVKTIKYNTSNLKVIKSYSFYNKGNVKIGNEYIYNDQGQVIQTIDHNQYNKYPICYKEIIKSTIKKAGRKFYFQGLERDSLIKNNETAYSWKVYFEDSISKYPALKHKFFRINAKTGKTITEEIVN